MDVLKTIHHQYSIKRLISHQRTGNWVQFNQDKQLSDYCKINGIEWLEFQSNGVIRDLKDRDGWSKKWNSDMKKELLSVPDISNFRYLENTSGLLNNDDLNIKKIDYAKLYKGGESEAKFTLGSFLNQRGQYYSKKMSSPLTAFSSCSRLSSYITYGNISIKEVFKATTYRQAYLRKNKIRTGWLKLLSSFSSRLRWHCHFIQKLEMQPNLEFTNMVRAYDDIRTTFESNLFKQWTTGTTGFPMIDACMRSLKVNGWINF
jgi:deoxyribodipyrimidine photo-lyase